jgi:hypothetical protein
MAGTNCSVAVTNLPLHNVVQSCCTVVGVVPGVTNGPLLSLLAVSALTYERVQCTLVGCWFW